MSEENKKFIEKLDLIKNQLFKEKEVDSNGRTKVSVQDFESVFVSLCIELANLYHEDFEFFKNNEDYIIEIFSFKNITFQKFSVKDLNSKLNVEYRNYNDHLYYKRNVNYINSLNKFSYLLFLEFTNSEISRLDLGDSFFTSAFRSLKLSNCKVSTLTISSAFFNDRTSKLLCQKCSFKTVRFNGDFKGETFFSNCNFKNYIVTVNQVTIFGEFEISESVFGRQNKSESFSFNNCVFKNTTVFNNNIFNSSPKFHGVTFHSDTSFFGTEFLDRCSSDALGDYRALKQGMASIGAEHDEAMFHSLEIESRANTILPKKGDFKNPEYPAKVAAFIIKEFNEYGRNYWKPLQWFIAMFLISGLNYTLFDGISCVEKAEEIKIWVGGLCERTYGDRVSLSFIYSLKQTLGPIGLLFDSDVMSPRNFGIKLLGTIQLIISSIMWFMYIVQIRRQFKL